MPPLPDRPCSAYDFVPTKDPLAAIRRDGIPIKSVRCLQHKRNNEVMITFAKQEIRDEFQATPSFHVKCCCHFVRLASTTYTYLTIYDAPHELPDSGIEEQCGLRTGEQIAPPTSASNGSINFRS